MSDLSFSCEELIVDIDIVPLTESDKEVKEPIDKRDRQLKRWFLTLNNPFWNGEDIDLKNNSLPVKYDYYNLEYIKSFNNIDLFEFHFVKVSGVVEEIQKDKVLKEEIVVEDGKETKKLVECELEKKVKVNKEFIVERPYFKSYETLKTYIENLSVEGMKYAVGQIEQGENETPHLQAGIVFDEKSGKRFYTMKKYFPTAYLDKVRGTNYDVKVYCTKEETRIMPPFEYGKFTEMRDRSDFEEYREALKNGATDKELMENFMHIVARIGLKNIEMQRDVYMREKFGERCRNVQVTYIYGLGGVGKTKRIYKEHKYSEVFSVLNYGQFMFHGYKYQKVLLLDEYVGQINLQKFNKLSDVHPYTCETKGSGIVACYDKIYIVSNLPYSEMYKQQRTENPDLYKTFDRRVHFIYEATEDGRFVPKRETIFEDIAEEDVELEGWTKRKSKVIEYDAYGLPHVVYDIHKAEQQEMELVKDLEEEIF